MLLSSKSVKFNILLMFPYSLILKCLCENLIKVNALNSIINYGGRVFFVDELESSFC